MLGVVAGLALELFKLEAPGKAIAEFELIGLDSKIEELETRTDFSDS